MKNLYKIVKEDEFEEMEVTELEKARVKSTLKKSLIQKEKRKSWKMKVVAAAMVCSLSVTAIGLAFPAYAGNIPIIGDIFKFLNEENYNHYKEFSTEMNLTAESKGIKITINDAIFDGKTVTVTYTIESEKALAGNIEMLANPPSIREAGGIANTNTISRIDDHHYVGVSRFTPFDLVLKEGEPINIDWKIDELVLEGNDTDIKGNWAFDFSLQATDSEVQYGGGFAEEEGIRVSIEKVVFTPMSFLIHYNQEASEQAMGKWTDVNVQLEVKDDLGNIYVGEGNGGFGKDTYTVSWSETFGQLDPNATKLIITPTIGLLRTVEKVQQTKNNQDEDVVNATDLTTLMEKELILDEIVIELED